MLLLLLLLQVVYGRWRKWEKRFVKTEGGSLSLAEARQVLQDGQALQQQLDIGAWLRPLSVYVEQCATFTDRARTLLDRAAAAAVAAAAVRVGWAVGSLDGFRRKGTLMPEDLTHVLELQAHRKQAEPTSSSGSSTAANKDAAPERRRAPYEQLVELIAIHGQLQRLLRGWAPVTPFLLHLLLLLMLLLLGLCFWRRMCVRCGSMWGSSLSLLLLQRAW